MGKLATLLFGTLAAALAAWFIGMRNGWRPVVDLQRRVNRDVLNPRMARRVGEAGGPTAVIHHTGRRSAEAYRTPVDAVPTPDGFAVASVYGVGSDWIRNVLAGGPTSVESADGMIEIVRAELVPLAAVEGYFSAANRRSFGLFGVKEAVLLFTSGQGHVRAGSQDHRSA
jgi:deazaflavin-dependent oxidoreductase (nitroreductase family)